MSKTTTILACAGLALALFAAPVLAQDLSPEGRWQSEDGEARVEVTLCGDGTALCAKLIGVAEKVATEKNLALVNTLVVDQAQRTSDNSWVGTVYFNGEAAEGEIVLKSADTISVHGCKGLCQTIDFYRL